MNDITLTVTHDDALVLFERLASLEERHLSPLLDDTEQTVVWRLEGQLESLLPDIVMTDYKERVAAAKRRLQGPADC